MLADGEELDGAGDNCLKLLVGGPLPLQGAGVDDEHVDCAIADGYLAGGNGVVLMDPDGGTFGLALSLYGGRRLGWNRAGQADLFGVGAGVEQGGKGDSSGHGDEHQHQRDEECAGAAALAHLANRDKPDLAYLVHPDTAWRKSSESLGGS